MAESRLITFENLFPGSFSDSLANRNMNQNNKNGGGNEEGATKSIRLRKEINKIKENKNV